MLTMLPVDLILGNDDLAGVDITRVGNRVVHDANDPDHLTHFPHTIHYIAGVTDQLLAPCNLWWANPEKKLNVDVFTLHGYFDFFFRK